jgi:epoxide hydrolase-like predicted phosphatase
VKFTRENGFTVSIQAIYFDIGGVLVRTMDRAPRTQLAARLGMTYEALEELVFGGDNGRKAQLGEITAEEQWAYVCQQVNWPISIWCELEAEFYAGDSLDAALVDYIRDLHRRYKTGIISNALSNVRSAIATKWHMADAFDVIITSADEGMMKPDARIFQIALQSLNVQPFEAVFVDDFPHNVEGARAVGMRAIQFRNPEQVRLELEAVLHS